MVFALSLFNVSEEDLERLLNSSILEKIKSNEVLLNPEVWTADSPMAPTPHINFQLTI